MTRSVRWSLACLLLASLSGCASERAPINRVQPNALEKSFFVGESLSDDVDDPQFYYRPTVADVDYGAAQSGLFTATWAQTTARVRWEVTEELLIARLAYERIEGSTGNGIEETNTGQIAAAFKIEKHFDVKRDYNSQTGEDLNVVVENDSDSPWYERKFMRVDWSQNLVTSAYDLDTLAALKIFADEPLVYEPVAYSVEDPSDPDAPVFDAQTGYFDVTNKVYAKPAILETPFGAYPACFFSPDVLTGGAPIADCNPVEVKVRLSFRKVEDRDYQPVDWDGTRMDMFGMFTTGERRGYERNYGIVDDKWYRFASRHNIWQQSHARVNGELVRCNTSDTTPPGADPDRDTPPVLGTADECDYWAPPTSATRRAPARAATSSRTPARCRTPSVRCAPRRSTTGKVATRRCGTACAARWRSGTERCVRQCRPVVTPSACAPRRSGPRKATKKSRPAERSIRPSKARPKQQCRRYSCFATIQCKRATPRSAARSGCSPAPATFVTTSPT
jgi:hypothetical protein